MWHYVAIHCVGVCVCAGQRISLSALARTHTKAGARDLPRDRKWRRKGRSQRRHRVSGQRRAEETSRLIEQSAEGGRRRWKQGREESQQKSERWLLKPDDLHRGRINQREKVLVLLVPFVEVSRKIHAGDSLQMHGECRVSQYSFSYAWNWPKSILFVCSSFHPRGCIFVAVKKGEIPRRKQLDESLAMNRTGLKKMDR